MTCTAQHSVTQADLDAGAVKNTASASGTTADGTQVTVPSTEVVVPAIQQPSIVAAKSTDTTEVRSIGEVIKYAITVKNPGNVTLTGVLLDDPNADAASIFCPETILAPGAGMDCTAVHTVTQTDLDAGNVVNVATASGTTPGGKPVSGSSDKVVVPAAQEPAVTTKKSSPTTDYVRVGDTIEYAIEVTNSGNTTLTGVTVDDPKADATPVCEPTTLAPAETAKCPAVHTVTQADLDAGSVINVATGAGAAPDGSSVTGPSDKVIVPAVVQPAVETIKTLASGSITQYSAPGDVIEYMILVRNTGNVTLSSISVADAKADTTPNCDVTSLLPDETATCTATHTVTQADLDAGSIVNVATARAQPPIGVAISDPSDPITVPATLSPALLTTKSSPTPSFSAVGDVIDYTITVKNTGNLTINSLTIGDPKADAPPVCAATTLAPGATTTCTAKHSVTQADLDAGIVDNVATASAVLLGGGTVSDVSDTVSVPAVQQKSLLTTKTLASGSITSYAAVGDVISYTIAVQNTGNVTVTGVAASDPVADASPGCAPTTLVPGATSTCTATHTVTQADLDRGSVDNVATGIARPPSGPAITDPSDTVSVPAVATPSMTAVKATAAASITSYRAPGEVIDYTITLTNTGNVTLSAVSVSDPVADVGSISCPAPPWPLGHRKRAPLVTPRRRPTSMPVG